MGSFSGTFRRLLTVYGGKLTNEFDELMAIRKESAPGPDVSPYSLYRCAGGLGSTISFKAYQQILAGVPLQYAASWDCLHSQVFRSRQQLFHCEMAGCTETANLV